MSVVRIGFLLVLVGWLNLGAAHAQERDEGNLRTLPSSTWENRWERSWEHPFRTTPFTLGLSMGRSTGNLDALRWTSNPAEDGSNRERETIEYYALATLQVPLQHFFLSPSKSSRESSKDVVRNEMFARTGSSNSAELAQGPSSKLEKRKGELGHDRQAASRDFLRLVRATLAKLCDDQDQRQERLESLQRRSRAAGWVPELRLRGVYGFDRSTSSEEARGVLPGETTVRGAQDSLLEARLTFRLDRLVFGDGEAGIERQRAQARERRTKRSQRALELLIDFREAEVLANDPSLLPEELLAVQSKADRAVAELHILTGGWFRGQPTIEALELRIVAKPETPERTLGSVETRSEENVSPISDRMEMEKVPRQRGQRP